jgi:uncharacterized protein YecE (DUF72 family)
MKIEEKIRIGTSGWQYEHWRGPFYPRELKREEMLPYYARRLPTVEITCSLHQPPQSDTVSTWRDTCHSEFTFTVKTPLNFSHETKLENEIEILPSLFQRIKIFDYKLGPILIQLSPHGPCSAVWLENFLENLPRRYRYAVELQHPGWYNARVFDALSRHGAALCIYDLAGQQSPKEITADFVYIRLHGPQDAYRGEYDSSALIDWAGNFFSWADQGKEIFCYFENDEAGYAVNNAVKLNKIINS